MKRLKRIDLVYQKIKEMRNKEVSAQDLAEVLGLSRANVSSDLNQLCKEGKVSKSNGRPVLFSRVEERGILGRLETTLDQLAKVNKSVKNPIEQAKAAILYPPKGMHTLILGETGVGKTMFAGLMHTYAIETKKLEQDAPFVTFNCADYAHNPQLLIGQLFGVKKGAYTGAEADRVGLIEKASGGILFLDEVHRLPAEGQEIFFTFMDKGTFRRLGETEERVADVLIISATTENPDSSLLKTFTRRIPMIIKLPSLRERGFHERMGLIFHFFREESYRLGKEIHISANAIRSFIIYECPNNIGQLKTDVQLACAKAYADFITLKKEQLEIYSCDLPHYVKEGLLQAKEYRQMLEELVGSNKQCFVFHPEPEKLLLEKEHPPENQSIYENIEKKISELRARGVSDEELELDIENYFTQYIRGVKRRIERIDLTKIIDPLTVKLVENLITYAESKLQKVFNQKVFFSLALHIQTLLDRVTKGKQIVNPQLNKVRSKYKKEFGLAMECVKMIEDAFHIDLPIDEAGFITMFFILEDLEGEDEADTVGVLVITHGSGGATAMVDVTNRLLGVTYAQAIDLPLETEPHEILDKAKEMARRISPKAGLILLVDMGSLLTFGEIIEKETGIPVKTVSMVSTPHVIEATRKAMLGHTLQEIYRDIRNLSSHEEPETEEKRAMKNKDKTVILTACLTGEGSALSIKNMLQHHLRYDEDLFEIIPINIINEEVMVESIEKWKREKNILCIVSSFQVDRHVPSYSIDQVLNLTAIREIQQKIDVAETYYRMGQTVTNHLKQINGDQIVSDVRKWLTDLQGVMNIRIPDEDLTGICLHMCCMVDRLISNESMVEYPNKTEYVSLHSQLYNQIKQSLKTLEHKHHIHISTDEICFLMNFFTHLQSA